MKEISGVPILMPDDASVALALLIHGGLDMRLRFEK
jgi:hypothetical protein